MRIDSDSALYHDLPVDDYIPRLIATAQLPRNPDAGLLVQDHAWAETAIPGYSD